MIKTICLIALIAFAYTQDVNSVVDAAQNAASTTTVGDAVNQAGAAAGNVDTNVAALSSLTVGWGPREVVATPQNGDASLGNWINGQANVARQNGTAAEGEWSLLWSVENGDDYALLHNDNGDFLVYDYTTSTETNIGTYANLDSEIDSGAEQLVDYVYDNEVSTISGAQISNWLSGVLDNNDISGFLSANNGQTLTQVGNEVAGQVSSAVGSV